MSSCHRNDRHWGAEETLLFNLALPDSSKSLLLCWCQSRKFVIMFCKLHIRGYLPALPFTFANVLKLPINCLSEKMTHSYLLQYLVKGSNSQHLGCKSPQEASLSPANSIFADIAKAGQRSG